MSREIKFRAWDGKIMHKQVSALYPLFNRDSKYECRVDDKVKDQHITAIDIMQYTGLKDKHGKEIYDGDILEGVSNNPFSLGDVNTYEVIWGVDSWHIKGTGFCIQELKNYCNGDIKVIGNIYENPELLK